MFFDPPKPPKVVTVREIQSFCNAQDTPMLEWEREREGVCVLVALPTTVQHETNHPNDLLTFEQLDVTAKGKYPGVLVAYSRWLSFQF